MTVTELDASIKTVCPIFGVSIGCLGDRSTWRIDFALEATDAQRQAAEHIMNSAPEALAIKTELTLGK